MICCDQQGFILPRLSIPPNRVDTISRNPEFRQIVCKEERCRAGGLQRRYFPDVAFSRITRYNTHQDEDDKEATAKEWTQKQFNDHMNNHAFYQIEDPHWNRSHRFAMTWIGEWIYEEERKHN